MEKAKDTSLELFHNNEEKYRTIWELFGWQEARIVHPIHAAAAFLNPSYMCSENFKEDSKMKNGIDFMLENLVSDDERHSFMQQIHIYRAKVSSLFTVTAKTMLKTSHPRVWWDYCGDSLPILKKYAIRILSQPCSFSSFKQSWNTFEASQTKMRNRFTPHILNNFVQVRMNMLMMAKFNSMETQDLLPIDLEKLRELPEYIDPPEEDWEHEVTNSTQENLNHDTGMCIATGYTGDGSVIGNVAHQYGGDGGGGFEGNEGSSSQAIGFSQTQKRRSKAIQSWTLIITYRLTTEKEKQRRIFWSSRWTQLVKVSVTFMSVEMLTEQQLIGNLQHSYQGAEYALTKGNNLFQALNLKLLPPGSKWYASFVI